MTVTVTVTAAADADQWPLVAKVGILQMPKVEFSWYSRFPNFATTKVGYFATCKSLDSGLLRISNFTAATIQTFTVGKFGAFPLHFPG